MTDAAIESPKLPDFDEFGYVAEIAAALGVTPLVPQRVNVQLDDAARGDSHREGALVSGIRWEAAGAPASDATPVVYLHGAGLNAHTFDTTVLAAGVPALALDLPGHGDSSWRADADYRARSIAPALTRAIEALTDGPVVLVGQSLGGLTAAAIAAARPELVQQLIVVDITPGIDTSADAAQIQAFFAGPRDFADHDELLDRALAFGLGGSREKARRGVLLNSRVRPDGRVVWKHHFAELASRIAAGELPVPGTAERASAEHLVEANGWHDLAAITAPVTLIRGDRGFVREADAEEFAARLPGATLITLPSGHNVQEDAPVALAATIATRTGAASAAVPTPPPAS